MQITNFTDEMSQRADYCSYFERAINLQRDQTFHPPGAAMYRKMVIDQAPSYVVAGLFLSMLVTFVVFDLDSVRQEDIIQYNDDCRADAARACPAHDTSIIRWFRAV